VPASLHVWSLHDASLLRQLTCLLSLHCALPTLQVNKDDLLSMVRYGAELVFSSEATNITGGRATYVSWGGTAARSCRRVVLV
jgi:hypothetical protein